MNIRWRDLTFIPCVSNPVRIRLRLPTEKNVMVRRVDWMDLPAGNKIDPVEALLCLLRFKASSLQRNVSRWVLAHGSEFVFTACNRHITRKWLNLTLDRYALVNKTERSLLSGHSFRIGASTELHRNGAPDSFIKMVGRWHSDVFLTYIRHDFENLAALRRQYFNN